MNNFKRFTLVYVSIVFLCTLLIGCFNWIVNPYGIYQSLNIKSVKNKPLVSSHLRLSKAMAVRWQKPDYLIMGSSTAETGLDPTHPGWKFNKVYNLGLSGANIYEVKRYLEHAESIHRIKKVIIVVNFFMFNAYSKNRHDFDESILAIDSRGNRNQLALTTFMKTLFSYDALRASLETLNKQDTKNAFLLNGQLDHDFRQEQIRQLKGYRNNFINAEQYNKNNLLPVPEAKYSFDDDKNKIHTIDYFKEIISLCEKNNTELVVIVAPEHVRLQETYHILGLDNWYRDWLTKLTELIEQHNQKVSLQKYSLWNFNLINQFTTEQLPPTDSLSKSMKWFWDPFHFKNELGNEILNIVLNNEKDTSLLGIRMNLSNLNEILAQYSASITDWEKRNQVSINELKQVLV